MSVSWRVEGDETVISIADRGSGIPEAERERVFRTFVQIGDRGDESGGTGLGLAIARGFTEAHGGKLWVEAGDGGVGSRFNIRLPIESTAATLHT